jgi:hypothetical protein
VARVGGDEFAIVAPGATELEAPALALIAIDTVVTAMSEVGTGRWQPDARCGWAFGPGSVRGLLQSADDDLLRRAKVERDWDSLSKTALRLASLASGPRHYLDAANLVVPPVIPWFDSEPGGAAWPDLEQAGLVREVRGSVSWSREPQALYALTELGVAECPYWLARWRRRTEAVSAFLATAER